MKIHQSACGHAKYSMISKIRSTQQPCKGKVSSHVYTAVYVQLSDQNHEFSVPPVNFDNVIEKIGISVNVCSGKTQIWSKKLDAQSG